MKEYVDNILIDRSMLYVAATRAMHRLTLTYSRATHYKCS